MRAFTLTLAALSIVLFGTVSVSAQDEGRGRGRGGFDREAMMARMVAPTVVRAADADKSGDITAKEWKAFTESVKANEAGEIDGAAFKSKIFVGMFDRNKNAKLETSDLETLHKELDKDENGALARNELGSNFRRGSGRRGRGGEGGGEGGDRPERIRLDASMRTVASTFRDHADADKSGDISAEEWKKFLDSVKTTSGTVADKTVQAWIAGPAPEEGEGEGEGRRRRGMRMFRSIGAQLDMALGLGESKTFKKEKLHDLYIALDRNEDGDIQADEMSGRSMRGRGGRGGRGEGGGGPSSGGKKKDEIL